ncbi:MAG TPA: hypothetical protein VFS44_08335 [Gemmatimonadaceae bacterium]|nr:hypothetical protein [Gemmatimonadaceae bacterium]
MTRWTMAACVIAAMTLAARGARAQDEDHAHWGLDRVGTYFSYTWIEDAKRGWELGGDIDVGSLGPRARVVLGLDYFKADADRVNAFGMPLTGGFHDFATTVDVRVRLLRAGPLEPFAGAGVGVHFLGNDIRGDDRFASRYEGTEGSAQIFGGTEVALTSDRRVALYGEVRRILARAVGRTTVRLGAFFRL